MPDIAKAVAPKAVPMGTGTSGNGRFTLTKTASATTLPYGGGTVTYTYQVKNTSASPLYFWGSDDNRCSPVNYTGGMVRYYEIMTLSNEYRLDPGQTATWTCTQLVTQTTVNTATFTFVTGFGPFGTPLGQSSATATETVTIQPPTGGYTCNTLWYTSDEAATDGSIGTLTTTGVATKVTPISTQKNSTSLTGSAAAAVNPSDSSQIYYIPRNTGSTYGGLYIYDTDSGTSTQVATPSSTPDVVRLAVAPDGTVWTIDTSGDLWSWTSAGGWVNRGAVTLPNPPNVSWGSLGSGDITFDGNGTMYIVASTSGGPGYLFTVSADQLAGTDGATAKYVGQMGPYEYNGIAFTSDGKLWATSTSLNFSYTSTLFPGSPQSRV